MSNLFVIGAQRCATTSFIYMLSKSSDYLVSRPLIPETSIEYIIENSDLINGSKKRIAFKNTSLYLDLDLPLSWRE